ncbi:MAG: hypothetical protein K6A78_08590 [Prevotella sp.]|nr:hypothetical protein [Prevotella sp.]
MKKSFLLTALMAFPTSVTVMAQSGTNSPYSQYGLGKIADQSIGMSRGMNGVGVAFRERNQVNYLNPASYSSIDSLTFVFDVGMSLQNTNFKENGKSKNAKNGDFEYAVASFRALKHLGMSFGILPYTNVGYNYSANSSTIQNYTLTPSTQETTTVTNTYTGSGGLHQIFIGAGWEPFHNFSVGVNVNYLFGNITNSISNSFSDQSINTQSKSYKTDVNAIKLDFGASHTIELKNRNSLTVGLTFSPGYKVGADWDYTVISKNVATADTTTYIASNSVAIPTQWGLGLAYKHASKWLVGLDYVYQRWSSVESMEYVNKSTGKVLSDVKTDAFYDRYKVAMGGQYCKNEYGRSFTDRLRYRFGLGYSSSYQKINGKDGPDELSVSVGLGIPIMSKNNNRSKPMINISLQWQRAAAKQMVTENTFLINIGLTFNERWFDKWKFD